MPPTVDDINMPFGAPLAVAATSSNENAARAELFAPAVVKNQDRSCRFFGLFGELFQLPFPAATRRIT